MLVHGSEIEGKEMYGGENEGEEMHGKRNRGQKNQGQGGGCHYHYQENGNKYRDWGMVCIIYPHTIIPSLAI